MPITHGKSIRKAKTSLPDQGGAIQTFNHPTENDVTDADLDYVNHYYHTTSDNLTDIFTKIISAVDNEAFYSTEEITGDKQNAMHYEDPIGEYMKVKNIKGVVWDRTLYNAVYDKKTGTCTLILAAGETAPTHPITGDTIDITQMTVSVKRTTENNVTLETLVIEIPNSCLPLRHDEITVENGKMTDYTSSRFETTPLRVLYTVGIQDDVKMDGGNIDLSKIDAAYRAKNITANGNIQFYSNRYDQQLNPTGDERFDDGAIGDTTVQFTPNAKNRYYFFQKNQQIYSDKDCTVPVSTDQVTDNSLPEGAYYFKIDYYVDDDREHGYIGDHTGYTETVVERTAEQLAGAVEVIDGNVYTKIGAARIGRLDYFSQQKENNFTETATYSFVPWMKKDNHMTVFLGNNGRLDVPNPYSFSISKEVTGNNTNQEDLNKPFQFSVKITDMKGRPLTGGYAYVGGSTVDNVIAPKNDVLTLNDNGEGSFALKHGQQITITGLPLGAKYTVTEDDYSADGFTTTANGTEGLMATGATSQDAIPVAAFVNTKDKPETGNLTVSKVVTGTAGETERPFQFTVTLDDKSISGTYGDIEFTNGVAEFPLKHNKSKTATGLPAGITYTVTESDNAGYTVTSTGETGTIIADETAAAHFNNHKSGGGDNYISLTVKKVWVLDDGGKTADSVKVELLKDGEHYEEIVLNAENGWTHTWTNLNDGYIWTVTETDVPEGFTSTISHKGSIWTITNDDSPKEPTPPVDPTNPVGPTEPTEPDGPIDDVPNTGDGTHLALYLVLSGISGMGVTIALLGSKRRYGGKHSKR